MEVKRRRMFREPRRFPASRIGDAGDLLLIVELTNQAIDLVELKIDLPNRSKVRGGIADVALKIVMTAYMRSVKAVVQPIAANRYGPIEGHDQNC